MYGRLCLDSPSLVIPHPGMLARSTVLVPLADIAPDLRHPVTGRTIREHLADLGAPLLPVPGIAPYPPGLPPSESTLR
jgi:7,8-dihydro-6-hydroxymethylpterin-pyrophosphokinase